MIARRDILLGGGALAGAGIALGLRPRKKLTLLRNVKMAAVLPWTFGAWSASDDPNILTPKTEGTLSAKLYSELVQRVYTHAQTGAEVMMLIAYGDTQSDLLQLHRPESCYPALGFNLLMSRPANVPLGSPGAAITGREVVAQMAERIENIVYWTRLGEYLPASSGQQRLDRLLSSFAGVIPDGALFRFSEISTDSEMSFQRLRGFIRDLVLATERTQRPALLGTQLASAVKA